MNQPRPLQFMVDDFLTQPSPGPGQLAEGVAPRRFSPFRPDDARRASRLAAEFGRLADEIADRREALALVIERAQALRETEHPEAVDFAFGLFVTHHRKARGLEVTPLELRAPEVLVASTAPAEAGLAAPMPAREPELAWFREDAKANEHHEHWHWVFANLPEGSTRLKDRHGEMFFYMHQQMLARYDAERRALGIDPADAFTDYGAPIGEGYDPGPGFNARPGPFFQFGQQFAARAAGAEIEDPDMLAQMEEYRRRLNEAIERGTFDGGVPVDSDTLGLAVEPGEGTMHDGNPSPDLRAYGWIHGQGHVAVAQIGPGTGVMNYPPTAIRDPFFWRWHREIDDFNFRWQEGRDEHRFEDDAPEGVRVRDVVIAFRDQIPDLVDRAAGERYGEETFGGVRWDDAPQAGTDALETMMCLRTLVDRTGQPVFNPATGSPYTLPYLDQRPFTWFHRIENSSDAPREITVRVWTVPEEDRENRRAWIELDKFRHTLQPGQKSVIYRPAQESSVIRKPAQKPPVAFIDPPNDEDAEPNDEENYCTCGWPYNLLIPRGTEAGARYLLMVAVTDYAGDQVAAQKPAGRSCGSVSFCGLRDDRFPDRKAMGYPFHRPFRTHGIMDTATALPNFAVRELTIRHVASDDPEPQYREVAPE